MKAFDVAGLGVGLVLAGCAGLGAPHGPLAAAGACADQTVEIYFEPRSAELTPEGRAVIDAAASQARACRVRSVEVLGLADAVGPADASFELSQRRAAAVTAALTANQLPAAEFRVGAAGQAGAKAADGERAPLRRRVDVTLRLSRP
jgi:outer membrane protein OmpA-like peptidoglycan-associated protein